MNAQLTNEQIARVFAMYLGCDVEYEYTIGYVTKKTVGKLRGIDNSNLGIVLFISHYENGLMSEGNTEDKLLLTPLSAITDEDAIEVAKMMMMGNWPQRKYITRRDDHSIDISTYGGATFKEFTRIVFHTGHIWSNSGSNQNTINTAQAYQYLIQKGYAVPLFIAPNHPANGKTAIELGIA